MSIFYVKNHLNIFEYFFSLAEVVFLVTFFDNFSLKKRSLLSKSGHDERAKQDLLIQPKLCYFWKNK